MVKHCLLVLLTNKFEYLKFDNVKLINKITIKEDNLTSLRTRILFLYNRLIFNLLFLLIVVIQKKKKNKIMISIVINNLTFENNLTNHFH
jgi:hypothetical protein